MLNVWARILILFFLTTTSFALLDHVHIGKIDFPTSGNEEAQHYFKSGVMWLHSFEYDQARDNFQKAIMLDPNFAMAYWGVAMTYNHPLWNEQDYVSAKKILTQLALTDQKRIQKAKTPIEKGFIQTINILYGYGNKETRDALYSNAMREFYEKNPSNDEIASFYALSLLGATEGKRDFQAYMQAAGIAEEIYQHNSQHPGALHYLIHTYDDPIHAPLGLIAARSYAKTAPSAAHALHMPSHIFLALGLWDDVIASNKAAWLAGVKQNNTNDAMKYTVDDLHALEWLNYGYLEKQEYDKAYQLTKKMENIVKKSDTPMSKWYYAFMRSGYILASHDWKANLQSFDMQGIELSARASDLYTNALIALNRHPSHPDIKAANEIHKELTKIISSSVSTKDSYPDYFTSIMPSGITSTNIIKIELAAQIAWLEGKKQRALQLLKKATVIEAQTSFGYGPPIPVKPSNELYGDYLLQDKQYRESYQQYIFSLKRMPNRIESKLGLSRTLKALRENNLTIPNEKIQPYFNKLMLPN